MKTSRESIIYPFTFDYPALTNDETSIASAAISVVPSGALDIPATGNVEGNIVRVRVAGGTDGSSPTLHILVTCADSSKFEGIQPFLIRDD